MMEGGWPEALGRFRSETHYDGRQIRCLVERPASLWQMADRAASDHGDAEAIVCEDFRCIWTELVSLSEDFASGLLARGVTVGDRVILFLDNRPEFIIVLFALARIGAVAVPVGTREQAPGLAYIAQHSGARGIIHEAALEDRIPSLEFAIAAGVQPVRPFVANFRKSGASLPAVEPDEEAPALIMYTSGTTGRPKGAVVTHLALAHIAAAYVSCMDLDSADRSACAVPLSHITGITATVCPMTWVGGAMVLAPHFDARDFVDLASREKITHSLLVPAMYNLLLARVDLREAGLGSWRIGGFGGAPMPMATIEKLAAVLPGLDLMNCYGATETCGAATIMPARHLLANSDSVGWPITGVTVRAVDERGQSLPAGEVGELWIGGATVTPGYWNDPASTSANLSDGQWKSGDLGSVDEGGFVRVHDRLKDMINRGGYKIFSAEVEAILMAHPAVLEAAVVSKPCPVLGERVHAFVTPQGRPDAALQTDLDAFCRARMTDYKCPESFTVIEGPLPRNQNGKVLKNELRQRLL